MRTIIVNQDVLIGENRRIATKLIKVDKNNNFPDGLEFVYQYLYFKDNEWQQIVRIDNQLHEGKAGTHIHILKRKDVKWVDLNFKEAEKEIERIAENVIKNIVDKL